MQDNWVFFQQTPNSDELLNKTLRYFEKTRRFAFQKNRFHFSDLARAYQNSQRRQSVMVGCAEDETSVFEAAKLLCLTQTCI